MARTKNPILSDKKQHSVRLTKQAEDFWTAYGALTGDTMPGAIATYLENVANALRGFDFKRGDSNDLNLVLAKALHDAKHGVLGTNPKKR